MIRKIFLLNFIFVSTSIYAQEISRNDTIFLEEVVIEKQNFELENLGYKLKKYTPAERRLNAASGGIVGFINLLNGTLRNLKNEVKVEKKELAIEKIENQIDTSFFEKVLGIPADYVKGFLFYIVEDKNILDILDKNDKELFKFYLINLSFEYKTCCIN